MVGDTTPIEVRALNRSGDSIPGAPITLTNRNPALIAIPPGALSVVGLAPGVDSLVAQAGSLFSDPFRVVVIAP